jgi:glutathione S-transferase
MESLTLFVDANYESPWALSAFIALEEKKLAYELKTMSLKARETLAPEFESRTKRIPSLKHQDFWLAESTAIQEYLAETFPSPQYPTLYPPAGRARAVCRELQHWVRSDLLPLRKERPTSTVWFQHTDVSLSADGLEAAHKFIEAVTPLISESRENLFEAWCVADVDVAVMLQRLNLNGFVLPAALKRYAERQWNRPSVAKWNALPRAANPV